MGFNFDGVALKDLNSKGFFNAKSFFDEDDIATMVDAYESAQNMAHGLYPTGTTRPAAVPARVRAKVEALITEINTHTDVRVDVHCPEETMYLRSRHFYDWHQDHESYYTTNDHFNYINVYAPIVKPDPSKTNLCVLPFDKLQTSCKALHDACYGTGASSYLHATLGSKRMCCRMDDAEGTMRLFDCDIDAITDCPHLKAGDALFIRGDVLHRTQDLETERIVLTLRLTWSGSTCNVRNLLGGSSYKMGVMALANPLQWSFYGSILLWGSRWGQFGKASAGQWLANRTSCGEFGPEKIDVALWKIRVLQVIMPFMRLTFVLLLVKNVILDAMLSSHYVAGYRVDETMREIAQANDGELALAGVAATVGPNTPEISKAHYKLTETSTHIEPSVSVYCRSGKHRMGGGSFANLFRNSPLVPLLQKIGLIAKAKA